MIHHPLSDDTSSPLNAVKDTVTWYKNMLKLQLHK